MALIKFGGGVAGISGKIGGTVYARNKAGAYARNWAKPTNTPTPSQSARRVNFGNVSAGWGGLTATDRADWNAQASLIKRLNRFGEEYVPSGRQYYMELNQSLSTAGLARITTPPTSETPPSLPSIAVAFEVSGTDISQLDYSGGVVDAAVTYILEATPVLPGNQKTNYTNLFRQFLVVPSAATGSLLVPYTALFGATANEGDVIAFRIQAINETTGLRSAKLIIEAIAVV